MYTYEYETVQIDVDGWGPFGGTAYGMCVDYREIVNERANNGWRFVGYIPTKQRGTGHMQEIDLIFEKEV